MRFLVFSTLHVGSVALHLTFSKFKNVTQLLCQDSLSTGGARRDHAARCTWCSSTQFCNSFRQGQRSCIIALNCLLRQQQYPFSPHGAHLSGTLNTSHNNQRRHEPTSEGDLPDVINNFGSSEKPVIILLLM